MLYNHFMGQKAIRLALFVVLGLVWLAILPTVPLSLWLLIKFQTAVGLALALLGLGGVVWGLFVLIYLRRPDVRYGRGVFVGGAIVVCLVSFVLWQTPSGRSAADSPISHQYSRSSTFNRWVVGNIVPEIEQMNLGFSVMPTIDPLLSVEQAEVVHPTTMAIYQEMETDPNFHELGSVMGWAYNELIGRPFDTGHYYLYVPQNRQNREPLPALVFLHGSGGSFKPYVWILSELAESEGYAIIAPSFGFGNWRRDGGVAAVLAAIADAQQQLDIDPDRIYLAGLSNGGLGVSLTAAAAPQQFRGLIFISPVMAIEVVDADPFLAGWQGRPILVISGAQDKRIPISYVQTRLDLFMAAGIDLTTHIYEEQDHFLFFAERQMMVEQMAQWLQRQN